MWSTRVCRCDEFVQGNDYLCAVCRLLPPAPRGYIPPKQPTSAEMVGMKPAPSPIAFKTGDSLSIAGTFKRRSFWQWLTRKPRELLTFTVVDQMSSLETEERQKVKIDQALKTFRVVDNVTSEN